MAEIKSTLDLVMERTRHLTMREEDKREQAEAEFRKTVNGLLQKYLDGELDAARVREEAFGPGAPDSDRAIAIGEIGKRIDPAGDNASLLALLREMGAEVSGIETVLKECEAAGASETEAAAEKVREALRGRGISGSAAVPNPAAQKGWKDRQEARLVTCREAVLAEIARLA